MAAITYERREQTLVAPFTIVVDGRERLPYRFRGIRSDARFKNRPIRISTEWAYLRTGDYTIAGMEDQVSIERKSVEDLFATLGQHRSRFKREHERLASFQYAAIIIEGSWSEILNHPPGWSRLNPKTVYRTALSWSVRFNVPWFAMEDRRLAEITTYRLLERFWHENGAQS